MSTYTYACAACEATTTIEAPIGTARRMVKCECGRPARMRLGDGLYVAAAATPNKRADVRMHTARESRWSTDMAAYKRMRRNGLQPPHIDGSERLEDNVGDQFAIDYHRALDVAPGGKDQVLEAIETTQKWDCSK